MTHASPIKMRVQTTANARLQAGVGMSQSAATAGGFVTGNYVPGLGVVDPFGPPLHPFRAMLHAISATALFRCWHIIGFFSAWATAISVINHTVHRLTIETTLLTVIGTVLGFVISYRTTSSFERYNEGRRLWSQIILGSRTFARTLWFHVPESLAIDPAWPAAERKARTMVEKMTAINLLLAFATGVKHYLRAEDGIFYEDLYHLVKFLPAYSLPTSVPSHVNLQEADNPPTTPTPTRLRHVASDMRSVNSTGGLSIQSYHHMPMQLSPNNTRPESGKATSTSNEHLPLPTLQTQASPRKVRTRPPPLSPISARDAASFSPKIISPGHRTNTFGANGLTLDELEAGLLPARNPPEWGIFDVFPFSLLVKVRTRRGKEMKGRKAARMRAKLRSETVSHNIPLEVSLYLSSYVAALQARKATDPPTTTALMTSITQLVDALTGLERILTTPIPFSYSVHLWAVCSIYCLLLPFQLWKPLGWLTIPATAILSFIFFGFLVAGEEIENPFGYDKNDLNMDHFCANIIRSELAAITSTPAPDVTVWAFSPANDRVFSACGVRGEKDDAHDAPAAPEEWVRRGEAHMREALSMW